jgi:hypothetical protein
VVSPTFGDGPAGKEAGPVDLGVEPATTESAGAEVGRRRLAGGGDCIERVLVQRGRPSGGGGGPADVAIGL